MAYGDKALLLRRCKVTRKDGMPCKAYAKWGIASVLHIGRAGKKDDQSTPAEKMRLCCLSVSASPRRWVLSMAGETAIKNRESEGHFWGEPQRC